LAAVAQAMVLLGVLGLVVFVLAILRFRSVLVPAGEGG